MSIRQTVGVVVPGTERLPNGGVTDIYRVFTTAGAIIDLGYFLDGWEGCRARLSIFVQGKEVGILEGVVDSYLVRPHGFRIEDGQYRVYGLVLEVDQEDRYLDQFLKNWHGKRVVVRVVQLLGPVQEGLIDPDRSGYFRLYDRKYETSASYIGQLLDSLPTGRLIRTRVEAQVRGEEEALEAGRKAGEEFQKQHPGLRPNPWDRPIPIVPPIERGKFRKKVR